MITELSYADIIKYYAGAYVRCKLSPRETEFKVVAILAANRDHGAASRLHIQHEEYGELIIDPRDPSIIWDDSLPESGLFNSNRRAYYFYRLPRRHSIKGCRRETSEVIGLTDTWRNFYNMYHLTEFDFSNIKIVKHIWQKNLLPWSETVMHMHNRTLVDAAITSTFGASQNITDKPKPYLWFLDQIIGDIDIEHQIIFVKYPAFSQEVRDFLRDMDASAWQVKSSI